MEQSGATKSSIFHTFFLVSMWWRIFYGCLRVLLGLTLLHVVGESLLDVVTVVMEHELLQKTPDFLFETLSVFLTEHQFSVTYFLAFYFIFWGVIDAILSYHLLKDDLWAFPISLILIGLFIVYSIFRFTYTHSLTLLAVIVTDMIILWMIYREYKKVLARVTPLAVS